MNVVSATSVVLKKLFATKTGAAFASSYHAKCRTETLTELLHPFKHDAKKKVWVRLLLDYILSQRGTQFNCKWNDKKKQRLLFWNLSVFVILHECSYFLQGGYVLPQFTSWFINSLRRLWTNLSRIFGAVIAVRRTVRWDELGLWAVAEVCTGTCLPCEILKSWRKGSNVMSLLVGEERMRRLVGEFLWLRHTFRFPLVLWYCWLSDRKGFRHVKKRVSR